MEEITSDSSISAGFDDLGAKFDMRRPRRINLLISMRQHKDSVGQILNLWPNMNILVNSKDPS